MRCLMFMKLHMHAEASMLRLQRATYLLLFIGFISNESVCTALAISTQLIWKSVVTNFNGQVSWLNILLTAHIVCRYRTAILRKSWHVITACVYWNRETVMRLSEVLLLVTSIKKHLSCWHYDDNDDDEDMCVWGKCTCVHKYLDISSVFLC